MSKNWTKKELTQKLTPRQMEILTGSLLGDGSITWSQKPTPTGNINAHYVVSRQTPDRDYLVWNAEEFTEYCKPYPVKDCQRKNRWNQDGIQYYTAFSTKNLPIFTKLRRKWYPEGKKIVPKDIKLTPLTIAVWFLDDGCIRSAVHDDPRSAAQCIFCTHCFVEADVKRLCGLLNKALGLRVGPKFRMGKTIRASGAIQYFIEGAKRAISALLKVILPVLPPGMERKVEKFRHLMNWTGKEIPRGEKASWSKLTEKQVIEIKQLLLQGEMTKVAIAARYSVNESSIRLIANGRNWKHVKLPPNGG